MREHDLRAIFSKLRFFMALKILSQMYSSTFNLSTGNLGIFQYNKRINIDFTILISMLICYVPIITAISYIASQQPALRFKIEILLSIVTIARKICSH